jgi:hypothetical protein
MKSAMPCSRANYLVPDPRSPIPERSADPTIIISAASFIGCYTGFLGSPFPPSLPGWPSGNSPVPWSNKDLVGCGIYSTKSGTDVDDIITTSLFVPLRRMLNATSPTGVTCAFELAGSLSQCGVVSTGCFRARLTPIRISSSKVPYPYARIIE